MHFLNEGESRSRYLPKARAAAKARLIGKNVLMLCVPEDGLGPCISVVRPDIPVCKLPDRIKVVSASGKAVKPSRGHSFYVTRESFNPFHGVIEISDGDM